MDVRVGLYAFELWCKRRLLKSPSTARGSNQPILMEINPEYSLEGLMLMLMLKLNLQYFGTWWEELTHWKRPWWWERLRAILCLVSQSCLTLCNPMDCSPSGSSLHGDSPGRNTGVGCLDLLQRIFTTQGSNPSLLHCRQILYCWATRGTPKLFSC